MVEGEARVVNRRIEGTWDPRGSAHKNGCLEIFSCTLLYPLSPSLPPTSHTFKKWFSRLLVRLSRYADASKTEEREDVSLAAFGRKEIEIAEVCTLNIRDLVLSLIVHFLYRMKCRVSCTFATRYDKPRWTSLKHNLIASSSSTLRRSPSRVPVLPDACTCAYFT